VNSFHVAIHDRVELNFHAQLLSNQPRQGFLIGGFDSTPSRAKIWIVGQRLQSAKLIETGDPVFANSIADQFGKPRVAEQQPAALGDSIGLVVEAFRIDFEKNRETDRL